MTNPARKTLSRKEYSIGWISPLAREHAFVLFDETHAPCRGAPSDHAYTFGSVGPHNVVLVCQADMGIKSCTEIYQSLVNTFKNLHYIVLVGIGGGAPCPDHDIRLGDVVISFPTKRFHGVIQYDYGTKVQAKHLDVLPNDIGHPSRFLRQTVTNLNNDALKDEGKTSGDLVEEQLAKIGSRNQTYGNRLRRPAHNVLYHSDCIHGDDKQSCETLRCAENQANVVDREHREKLIDVHVGLIASGNRKLRDAKERDRLIEDFDVLCFEMEAAGLGQRVPWLVVRGICDYCDSHKNKEWQDYAAASAAAYTYLLLLTVPSLTDNFGEFSMPFGMPEAPYLDEFIGRDDELEQLREFFIGLKAPASSNERRVMAIHGLGGMGKTQLAIQHARVNKHSYSAVLWFKCHDLNNLLQSFASLVERLFELHPDSDLLVAAHATKNRMVASRILRQWLSQSDNHKWLMIFDNVTESNYKIQDFFPKTEHGSILITCRYSRVSDPYRSIPLKKLAKEEDGLQILKSRSKKVSIIDDPDALTLVERLGNLPIALATAGAYLNIVKISVAEYLEIYDKFWHQLDDDTPSQNNEHTLFTTWDMSLDQISKVSKNDLPLKLLRLWRYFSGQDLWFELLEKGQTKSTDNKFEELLSNFVTFLRPIRTLLRRQGMYEEARTVFERLLKIREDVSGADSETTHRTISDLGKVYNDQNELKKADSLLSQVVARTEHDPLANHKGRLQVLVELAHNYRLQKRYNEAAGLASKGLVDAENLGKKDCPEALQFYSNLGWVNPNFPKLNYSASEH